MKVTNLLILDFQKCYFNRAPVLKTKNILCETKSYNQNFRITKPVEFGRVNELI